MNEKYLIEGHGFRNVVEGSEIIGFEIGIRIAYYRGIALNIIAGLKVIVDGEVYEGACLRLGVSGRCFTMEELAKEERIRWEFDQGAKLLVLKPGGLAPGAHSVQVFETIKPAYMSGVGFTGDSTRTMTLGSTGPLSARASRIGLGVSLYSYQEEYLTRAMTLEDCIAEVAAIGASGVQLIAEQMMSGYPEPGEVWLDNWHRSLAHHGVRPTLMDTFVDMDSGGHRNLSIAEGAEVLHQQMRLAQALGFTMIRPTTGPVKDAAPELIEAALPFAEELNIKIAPEIHAPIVLQGPYVQSYIELIERTGTKHLGFTLDMGVFCTLLPPPVVGQLERMGARPEIIDYLTKAFMDRLPHETVVAKVETMDPSSTDRLAAMRYRGFGPPINEPEHLRAIMPYVFNVHGKFYEMTPECVEESIPYAEVLSILVEEEYRGSIDSEYEGQRFTQDAYATDSCEQVRRHHAMMRNELAALS